MAVERVADEPFAQLNVSLIRNPDLSDAEYRVYSELLSYRWQNSSCFPGQKRMAAEIGKSERGLRSALDGLEKKGLIKRHHRGQRYTDEYTFPDRQDMPLPINEAESLDRQILPFPIDSDRQSLPLYNPDRQNTTSLDRQILPPNKDSIEKDSVVKPKRIVNPVVPTDHIEDNGVRLIAVALEQDTVKHKEIVRIRKEIDRSIYSHLDFVKVAEAYMAWQDTKPEKKRDTDRVTAFIHQLEYKRTYSAYFKETAPRPERKPITSNESSTTTYVRYDTPITATVPQAAAMFQAIKETGTCPMKTWEELQRLKAMVRDDGTLVLLASDEQMKQNIERLHRHRIDMACRESHLQFEIGVGA